MKTFLVRAGGYGGGIGDVVFTEKADGTGREYFLYNATGTTSALTDDDGVVTSTSCYTAWGIETATQGETENIRKFSTKERSASIGLDYFGFRYYDYDLGRFTTRDPSGYPDGPNNYLYCDNNPVSNIDPLGLAKKRWEEDLLQKHREGLARQRHREYKEAQNKAAQSISGIATRRVELYEGSTEDKRIVAESSKVYNTSVKSGVSVGKAVMELHPATAISRIKSGKDLDGNDIPIAERVLEVASVIPVVKIVDKGLDAAKGITKLVKAGEKAGEAAKVYGPTARRVKLRQSVKEQLLERQPRNIEGQIIDPNNGKVIEGNYDIGHKPGHEWRNNKIEYEKQGFTRKQVIEAGNNPDNYHLEDPSSNRSHKYEKK